MWTARHSDAAAYFAHVGIEILWHSHFVYSWKRVIENQYSSNDIFIPYSE